MYQLISQDIEPLKYQRQRFLGIFVGLFQCNPFEFSFLALESIFPIFVSFNSILMFPERLEYKLVVHQQPNGARKIIPDGIANPLLCIQGHHFAKVGHERFPFLRQLGLKIPFIGISCIEGDPQENELPVVIIHSLRAVDPTYGALYTKAQILGKTIPDKPLLFLQSGMSQQFFSQFYDFLNLVTFRHN